MIAVDSSALAAFLLREEGWKKLAKHLKLCVSVDLAVKEVANAIWKACIVRGFLTQKQALEALNLLTALIGKNLLLKPEEEYLEEAFKTALKTGLTVYDSLYIALALREKIPLLTLDKQQGKVAEKLGVKVVKV